MKKEVIIHLSSLVFFFAIITLFRRWFRDTSYLFFWLGGLLGTILPDLDHLLYVFLLRPSDLTSQRVASMFGKRQLKEVADLLYRSRYEHTLSIFHTNLFQILFTVFAFFIISSSGSLLGRGLVLAFMLHLLVDQLKEHFEKGGIDRWFQNFPVKLNRDHSAFYLLINLIIIIFFGILF